MTQDMWALVAFLVVANGFFIYLIVVMMRTPKRPAPKGRARAEYGQGIVPSAMQNDMMDRG